METVTKKAMKGGEFLIKETLASQIFIPEEWNEEQKMIAQSCHDFLATEVWPILDRIDAQEEGLMVSLMNKAADLGLLGLNVPESAIDKLQYFNFKRFLSLLFLKCFYELQIVSKFITRFFTQCIS